MGHIPDHTKGPDGPRSWFLDREIRVVYLGQEIDSKPYMPDNSSRSSGATGFPKINLVIG